MNKERALEQNRQVWWGNGIVRGACRLALARPNQRCRQARSEDS